jgi:integrase
VLLRRDRPQQFGLPNFWVHPARKITKLKNKKNTDSHLPWSDKVWDLAIKRGRHELVQFIKAASYTGQRGGDVARMKLSDFKDGLIHVVQEKTGAKVWIAMVPELQALIEEAPKTNILLFPNSRGNAWEATAWGSAIRKLMLEIGHPGYSLHGLRKNATIELLEAGCTYDEIKAITGHETTAMIELYGKDIEKNARLRPQSPN